MLFPKHRLRLQSKIQHTQKDKETEFDGYFNLWISVITCIQPLPVHSFKKLPQVNTANDFHRKVNAFSYPHLELAVSAMKSVSIM